MFHVCRLLETHIHSLKSLTLSRHINATLGMNSYDDIPVVRIHTNKIKKKGSKLSGGSRGASSTDSMNNKFKSGGGRRTRRKSKSMSEVQRGGSFATLMTSTFNEKEFIKATRRSLSDFPSLKKSSDKRSNRTAKRGSVNRLPSLRINSSAASEVGDKNPLSMSVGIIPIPTGKSATKKSPIPELRYGLQHAHFNTLL